MKKYTVFGSGMDTVLTEAEVIRLGFKHAGVVGLMESISAFENADIAIVPETSGGDEEDEEEIAMNEGLGDFLKDSLSKLKGGKISDDDFDKYYAEKVASGDVNPSNLASQIRKNRENKPVEGTSIRGVGFPSVGGTRRLDFDRKPDISTDKKSPISTEDRSKKVDNYRKMFRMDMGKFKKIFEIAPELVDEFKSFIDSMVDKRDRQFASLSEAETAPAQAPVATAPAVAPNAPQVRARPDYATLQKVNANKTGAEQAKMNAPAPAPQQIAKAPVAQPASVVAQAPAQPVAPAPVAQPAPQQVAQAPVAPVAQAPAKAQSFQEPANMPTVNDVIKQGVGAKGLANVQKKNAPVTNAVKQAGAVAQAAIKPKG